MKIRSILSMTIVVIALAFSAVTVSAAPARPLHIECQFTTWTTKVSGPTNFDHMNVTPAVQALVDSTDGGYCGQIRSLAQFTRPSSFCNDKLWSAIWDGTFLDGEVGPVTWSGCGGSGYNLASNPLTESSGCWQGWGQSYNSSITINESAGRSNTWCI